MCVHTSLRNALVHVFELGALANLGIDIKVAPKNNTPTLFPSVTTLSMNVTVEQSSIGAITIAPLQVRVACLRPYSRFRSLFVTFGPWSLPTAVSPPPTGPVQRPAAWHQGGSRPHPCQRHSTPIH